MDQKQFDAVLSDAETQLRRLKTLYEQWFMGIERVEPALARKELEDLLARLRKEQVSNTAQRFRLQQLVQRHVSFSTYWRRIGRQIEEGTFQRDVLRARRRAQRGGAERGDDGPEMELSYDVDIEAELADVLEEANRAAEEALAKPPPVAAEPITATVPQPAQITAEPNVAARTFFAPGAAPLKAPPPSAAHIGTSSPSGALDALAAPLKPTPAATRMPPVPLTSGRPGLRVPPAAAANGNGAPEIPAAVGQAARGGVLGTPAAAGRAPGQAFADAGGGPAVVQTAAGGRAGAGATAFGQAGAGAAARAGQAPGDAGAGRGGPAMGDVVRSGQSLGDSAQAAAAARGGQPGVGARGGTSADSQVSPVGARGAESGGGAAGRAGEPSGGAVGGAAARVLGSAGVGGEPAGARPGDAVAGAGRAAPARPLASGPAYAEAQAARAGRLASVGADSQASRSPVPPAPRAGAPAGEGSTPSMRPPAAQRAISPFALPAGGSLRPKPIEPPKPPPPPPAITPKQPAAAARAAPPRPPAPQPSAAPKPAAAKPPAAASGGDFSSGDVERVYTQYLAARQKNSERTDNVKRDTIEKTIRGMLPQLEKKHAGKKIDFEVVVKDGKVALKPVAK